MLSEPSDHPRRSRTVLVIGIVIGALLVVGSAGWLWVRSTGSERNVGPAPDPPVAGAPTLRFSPTGTGDGRGPDWSRAAPLSAMTGLMTTSSPGTQALLLADAGPYRLTAPIILRSGGTVTAPVIVRGVDRNDAPQHAEIIGTRGDPYRPGAAPGNEAFRLLPGADNLVVEDIMFRNIGNGCIRIGGDVEGLTIRRVNGANVRRFIENNASEGASSATVSGLTVSDVSVIGFSRAFARLDYDSHDISFVRVKGDSMGQDGDPFAAGVDLRGTVHAVSFRDVEMKNAVSTRGQYWNGDGFSSETGTYDLTFERTLASGNTDAGYDLKSTATRLIDVVAADNKRNFRFWGQATMTGCTAKDPKLRGGTGTQAQVHALGDAVVSISRCSLVDGDPRTQVFDIDDNAKVTINDSSVRHAPGGALQDVRPSAALQSTGLDVN